MAVQPFFLERVISNVTRLHQRLPRLFGKVHILSVTHQRLGARGYTTYVAKSDHMSTLLGILIRHSLDLGTKTLNFAVVTSIGRKYVVPRVP